MPAFLSKIVLVLAGVLVMGVLWMAVIGAGPVEVTEETLAAAIAATTSPLYASTSTSSSITSTTSTTSTTLPARTELVIQGTGDVNLDPEYIPALGEHGYDYAWEALDGLFLEDDLTVINLECAPSDLGAAERKDFVFRCPTESLKSLQAAGIEVASMGNNHSGDYGKPALVDGRAQLTAAGVAPVGAGIDAEEAGLPAVFEMNGWKVAVIGFGGVFPNAEWSATDERAGMSDGDDIHSMVATVRDAARIADVVVVAIHWGVELDTEPRADDVERARAMVAAGADVIFGHHPHRLQPFESMGDAAVFWSLGNFVWPHFSTAGSTTGVARAVVQPDGGIEACLIPAFIENSGQPVLTGDPEC